MIRVEIVAMPITMFILKVKESGKMQNFNLHSI